MQKTLSLNTQLAKISTSIKRLRDLTTISPSDQGTQVTDQSTYSLDNHQFIVDIIYSLRDIKYDLLYAGMYKAKRKAQVKSYSIKEILQLLESKSAPSNSTLSELYKQELQTIKIELETVEQYIDYKNTQALNLL